MSARACEGTHARSDTPAGGLRRIALKVLHLTGDYGVGGTESFLLTLAQFRTLCPRMEPRFLVAREGNLSERLRHMSVPIRSVGEVRLRWPRRVRAARLILREWLKQEPVDAAIFHQYAWLGAVFAPVTNAAKIPSIRWFHNEIDSSNLAERYLNLRHPGFPDRVICNSEFTKSSLERNRRESAVVVYMPIAGGCSNLSEADRAGIRSQSGTPAEAVVIVQVGRISERKGFLEHLLALARIKDNERWVCWMIGGAQTAEQQQYYDDIRARAQALGIANRVHFLGMRADVMRLLRAADIYCQPNILPAEPFGISIVEAMYAGLPVITTGAGGALEIVDADAGILLPPSNQERLVDALKLLIENPVLRRQMGEHAAQRARLLCDPATQLRRIEQIVGEML
jgi:glycosyltransferase involved in cell wall biosynthesis